MFEISQNGPLIRGVIKEFIFSKIAWNPVLHLSSFQGREAALTASWVEDFGLQAILEKMNSLITPWFVDNLGYFKHFSKIFDIFSKFVKIKNSSESGFSTIKDMGPWIHAAGGAARAAAGAAATY